MNVQRIIRLFCATVLIFAFGLFNIGLPVVLYLCPLMTATQSSCPMSHDGNAHELSFQNQNPSCCGKVIVAERNTTPFVKTHSVTQEKITFLASLTFDVQERAVPICALTIAESPHSNAPPLFLLNATLLI